MLPRRLLAAIAAALAAVVSVAVWSARPEVSLEARGASAPGDATASPSELVAATDSPESRETAQRDPARTVEPAASAPPRLEVKTGGVLVRVVGEDEAPLAGVPVTLSASLDAAHTYSLAHDKTRAPDGLAALHGDDLRNKKLPAGAAFSVAVRLPLEPRVERALDGWTPGEPWGGGTIELRLPASALGWLGPLKVEVVDTRGAPVPEAEVVLAARPRIAGTGRHELGRARTRAPDGVAEIEREKTLEWYERARPMQIAFDLEARCAEPFPVEPSAPVDPESSRPTRVSLPPTGALVVRLVDPERRPIVEPTEIGVSWYAPGADACLGRRYVRGEGGVARLERVGLGLELSIGASLEDGSASAPSVRRVGPAREGELVEVELAFGAKHPRVVGRLVDERREPAPSVLFWLDGQPLEADAEGRFSIPWPSDSRASGTLRFEERDDPKLGAPEGWIPRWAEVPFPPASGDGRFDAGDVALHDLPVLLAGRVVDASGTPVRQAWLSVQRIEHEADEGDPSAWCNLKIPGVSSASTRQDGTFEVRSFEPVRVLRLSARAGKLTTPTVVAAPGTRGLELVAAPGEDLVRTRGRVRGRVRIEPEVPWLWIEAALVDAKGRTNSTIPFAGVLSIENVLPGTYRLELRTMETRWPLAAVDGVVVEAGAATRDPRLDELDLTGKTRAWNLRLEDAAGKPLPREPLRVGDGSLSTDAEGRIAFLAPVELATVRLMPQGRAAIDVEWSQDEQRVLVHE